MTPDDLRELIKQPESDVLEFKVRLPDIRHLAKLISAFANTKGGFLIVGVKEGGEVVGVDDPDKASRIFQAAATLSKPHIRVDSAIIKVDGKAVLVGQIHKGPYSPYLFEYQIFQRIGDRVAPITSDALYDNIQARSTSNEAVLAEVKRLSATIEQLNRELISAKSWRRKIPDMVLGGIIGAVISIAIALLLSIL